ncbi:hypothetical protein, partial [Capnocytophaga cynodegmi]|uniref:hypothetical protein n=1 Tax=Capnocytophaga cynodegmi TaxID=28189 RepID=UPI003571218D
MRRIIFFIVLLSNLSFSQEENPFALMDLTNIYIKSRARDRLCTSIAEIKVVYKDGESEIILYIDDNSKNELYPADRYSIKLKKEVKKIEVKRIVVDATLQLFGRTCCINCSVSTMQKVHPHSPTTYCSSTFVDYGWKEVDRGQAGGGFKFNYKIRPHHTLSSE